MIRIFILLLHKSRVVPGFIQEHKNCMKDPRFFLSFKFAKHVHICSKVCHITAAHTAMLKDKKPGGGAGRGRLSRRTFLTKFSFKAEKPFPEAI